MTLWGNVGRPNSLLQLNKYDAAELLDARANEKAEESMSDRREGWSLLEKIIAAVVVAALLGGAGIISGLDTKVEALEKNEIRRDEQSKNVLEILKKVEAKVELLLEQGRGNERRR